MSPRQALLRRSPKSSTRSQTRTLRQAKRREKHVYFFGGGKADGTAKMRELLGGKGANLAEMAGLGLPVPPGFTITTEVCTYYYAHGRKYPAGLRVDVEKHLQRVESILGARFGDSANPLLVSVRSGARSSMPGMMETILNVGLNDVTREDLIAKTGNPRFVYDAQRRLIQMYSDVVMEKAAGIEPTEGKGIRQQLEHVLEGKKRSRGVRQDTDLTADDLRQLIVEYKKKVLEVLGTPFPEDPLEQLWGGIGAVFQSWNGRRAIEYRRIEKIPDEWGTAVNVQAMVFGNMGDTSATGVGFTRDPATGAQDLLRRMAAERARRRRRRRHSHAVADQRSRQERPHAPSAEPRDFDAQGLPAAREHRAEARASLPGHARHRVHDPGRAAVDAAVPGRQAKRRGGREDGRRHGERKADLEEGRRAAGQSLRAGSGSPAHA